MVVSLRLRALQRSVAQSNRSVAVVTTFSGRASQLAVESAWLQRSSAVGHRSRQLLHAGVYRAFSTSCPSSAEVPSGTKSAQRPLSFSARSDALRQTTRKQLQDAQLALESLQAQIHLLRSHLPKSSRTSSVLVSLLVALSALLATYHFSTSFRTFVIATDRCGAIGLGVVKCIVDYKILFSKTWSDDAEGKAKRHDDYEACHTKCAVRIREILRRNGGIYIKLGQHLSSLALIPPSWSQTMLPLQDQCTATPFPAVEAMFLSDTGAPLSTFFSSFDPEPIGVASLAQVHIATERGTGRKCAVKVMHERLEDYCAVDMIAVVYLLGIVKAVFPSFEFTWLGEEMQLNLPLEMDFRHEAANASRCKADFATLKKTPLIIPDVLWAKRRVLVMEFIEGSRLDDLEYLARHNIDRNRVSQELTRIFSRMIYITGFFHGDPHLGNSLVRPAKPGSRSPYNFEIVLLDHGLYFDMEESLRVNYAHLWLALIDSPSPKVELARRKYAALVGNIDATLYPIFQAAITGRAALENAGEGGAALGSMMEMGERTREEERRLRHAVMGGGDNGDGLLGDILMLLRKVPRRMLMVFKVNDLTRAVDASLHTTHGPARVFLIVAYYCNLAVYQDDLLQLRTQPFSLQYLSSLFSTWWRYKSWNGSIRLLETVADVNARVQSARLWWRGFRRAGWERAWNEAAGLGLATERTVPALSLTAAAGL